MLCITFFKIHSCVGGHWGCLQFLAIVNNNEVVVVQSPSCVQLFMTPMDCSTPGLPVPHHLPKTAQVHVYYTVDAVQPSHPLTPSSPVLDLS